MNKTKMLNVKHLHYIATRAGVCCNKDCGFGLFGKLHNMAEQRNINYLENAQRMVRHASTDHTVYRAILSLDNDTALAKGFYKREAWEALVKEKINCIAKGMGVEQNDLRYLASMHYKKGHPHIHLMFWDSSSRIHNEYINKDAFTDLTEKIRAEFNKSIFKEEITAGQTEKKETLTAARTEMLAMMRELNDETILDINRVQKSFVNTMNTELEIVIADISKDKSRRYAYLKPQAKESLDGFIDKIFEYPQFRTIKKKYITQVNALTKLYGNAGTSKEENIKTAMAQFHKEVGNEILKFVKENDIIKNYVLAHPPQEEMLMAQITAHIAKHIQSYNLYNELKNAYPSERTPLYEFIDEPFKQNLHKLILEVLKDGEIGGEIYLSKSFENYTTNNEDFSSNKKSEIYGKAYTVARQGILNKLYDESGYRQNYQLNILQNMFMTLFSELGRTNNYIGNKIEYHKDYSGLSEAAIKDLRAKRKQAESSHEM